MLGVVFVLSMCCLLFAQCSDALFDRFNFAFGIGFFLSFQPYNLSGCVVDKTFVAKFAHNGAQEALHIFQVFVEFGKFGFDIDVIAQGYSLFGCSHKESCRVGIFFGYDAYFREVGKFHYHTIVGAIVLTYDL